MYNGLMDNTKELKVAVYARVSTEHEEQLSALENQIDWYKGVFDQHPNWKMVEQYVDEGITGTSAEKRPQFMRMMRDAKRKKFELIITREVSRFARNTVDTLQYTRMLRSLGVEVYFLNDGINTADGDGELRLTIMATLAQEESRKTSIRVKAGQKTSREKGVYYGSGNILGYDRNGKQMVVNPEQAETVRLIFQMYLEGLGLKSIKYELERLGRKTAMGKDRWFEEVIAKVLRNPFYCGIIRYNFYYTPSYLEQKPCVNRGQVPMTFKEGTHEPIISKEDFERVQEIMASKRQERDVVLQERSLMRGLKPHITSWGNLLRCQCGAKLCKRTWYRDNCRDTVGYLCYTQSNRGTIKERNNRGLSTENICCTPSVPEWKLHMMAVRIFNKYLSNADKVLALAQKMVTDHIADTEISETQKKKQEALNEKTEEFARLKKKYDSYIEMRSEGLLTKEDFLLKTDGYQDRFASLQNEINQLMDDLSSGTSESYAEKLDSLKASLDDYVNTEYEYEVPDSILEAFIERIVVRDNTFEWYLRSSAYEALNDNKHESEIEKIKRLLSSTEHDKVSMKNRVLLDSFQITREQAVRYQYSIDVRRRVFKWKDITVNIYI